jgi:hypothetical protein
LEQSLTTGEFATPEVASAWLSEIERRIESYDRGEMRAIGADAALERMRQRLTEHRARRVTQ